MRTLKVAFVWNQHQPYYKNLFTGKYQLPWVRLHGTKDYYSMVALLSRYPKIKATFNLTPCLIEQIVDYQKGALDTSLLLMRPPKELSHDQRRFLLERFFDTSWNNRIYTNQRYSELLDKRDLALRQGLELFSSQDFLDLQVLFNLAWLDQEAINTFPGLENLLSKKRNYSEEDKSVILDLQRKILGLVLPTHVSLAKNKQIELITSPYFHPILPLLAKLDYEDACWQVKEGLYLLQRLMGEKAKGLWLPELAISQEAIKIAADNEICWTISDEDILAKSLKINFSRNNQQLVERPEILYKPYFLTINGKTTSVFFRDHHLSDLIGFVYNRMPYKEAAEDLIRRLDNIYRSLERSSEDDFIVTIALDGENPWNEYPEEKTCFLNYLYQRLSSLEHIKTTTPKEFLFSYQKKTFLSEIAAGSWVNNNFDRWIGSPSKDKAWALLKQTSNHLKQSHTFNRVAQLSLYAAQGSDFPWWFDSMPLEQSRPFDELFRMHLSNVYLATGTKPPRELFHRVVIKGAANEYINGPLTMVPNLI